MRTPSKSIFVAAGLTAATLLSPTAAFAHPESGGVSDEGVIAPGSEEAKQHGGIKGHLPAKQENVTVIGEQAIDGADEGRVADVAAFGNYAYLTVRDPESCADAGVAIMDINDPTDPEQVKFISATNGSFPGEGAQVLDIATKSFTGQVLLFNNEICSEEGLGGVSMWDVTNPLAPVVLSANAGDDSLAGEPKKNLALNDIHSVLGWTDGGKAYAAIVDNAETADVDILDISDPRRPKLISESDLNDFDVLQTEDTPLGGNSFLHDVEVQEIDGVMTMVASYWDGGWTLLDVDNPKKPVYVDDYDYDAIDKLTGLSTSEGNAHQAEFSPDGSLIVGTDEDFSPFRLTVSSGGNDFQAAQGSDTPQIDDTEPLSGPGTYVGLACPALPADGTTPARPADVFPGATEEPGQIAVIERGICTFSEKVRTVEAAGYDGAIIFNSVRPDGCSAIVTPSVEAGIPTASIARGSAYTLFGAEYDDAACLAGGAGTSTPFAVAATTTSPVTAGAVFDGWGYTRLMTTDGLQDLGAYAIPEALNEAYATGFGDLSVHEVAVDPRQNGLAYLSYYSGGLRVIAYGTDGITEVGAYIAEGGNNFWGVEFHVLPSGQELILASDRDTGLWIFDYTGEN